LHDPLGVFTKLQCSPWQRYGLGASIEKNIGWKFSKGCSGSTTRGITVPAFSFEKIPAPPRIIIAAPLTAAKPRGRFARLVDRLTMLHLKSTEARARGRGKARKMR
jgi:hypothetical protein